MLRCKIKGKGMMPRLGSIGAVVTGSAAINFIDSISFSKTETKTKTISLPLTKTPPKPQPTYLMARCGGLYLSTHKLTNSEDDIGFWRKCVCI